MNRPTRVIIVIQGVLVAGFALGLYQRWFPLGVPGEWEWLRLPSTIAVNLGARIVGAVVLVAYAGFAVVGLRALGRSISIVREAGWLAVLAGVAVGVQAFVQESAPEGYGLAKWIIALQNEGSSGYHSVAKNEMPAGLGSFLHDFPSWIERQDSLHIGTHPPGLFVVAAGLRTWAHSSPELARWVVDHAPGSVAPMIRATRSHGHLAREDAAALVLTGALTLVGSALTVIPLYLLVRASRSAPVAWTAATFWPVLPSALLFQPTADTAFPLLSTAALAAASWAVRPIRRQAAVFLAGSAGVILAVGMEFTLAFLAVGFVVAIILTRTPGPRSWRSRGVLVGLVGLGFILGTAAWWGVTAANPLAVWWTNQQHHARFYHLNPRSRWTWSGVNLVESAVAIGIPTTVLAVVGVSRPRSLTTASWGTLLVLTILTVSGRSLSEVARLWLPLFPPILAIAATGWERLGGHPLGLGFSVACLGLQAMILQAMIQVVYPI